MTQMPGQEDCVLVFGGSCNGMRLGDVHRAQLGRAAAAWDKPCKDCDDTCEAATVEWTCQHPLGVQPCPRSAHAAAIFEEKLIICGGEGEAGLLNDCHILDTFTWTWSSITPSLPYPLSNHTAVALPGIISSFCFSEPCLFLFGGRTLAPCSGETLAGCLPETLAGCLPETSLPETREALTLKEGLSRIAPSNAKPGTGRPISGATPGPVTSPGAPPLQYQLVRGITLLHRADDGQLVWRAGVAANLSPDSPREVLFCVCLSATHTHTHTHTNRHTHIRTHAHVCPPPSTHTCMQTHAHTCMQTHANTCMQTHAHTCTHTHACKQMHTHACKHMQTRACKHMHTHAHVCCQAPGIPKRA